MSARISSPGGPAALAAHEAHRAAMQARTWRIIAGPPGTPTGTLIITHETPRNAKP